MAKSNKQSAKSIAKQAVAKAAAPVTPVEPVEVPVAPVETKKQRASRVAGGLRRAGTLAQAIAHNKAIDPANPESVVKADIVATDKGANEKRRRVYGYDNGSGGMGVPKAAKVLLVPGFTGIPRGVNADQWAKLQSLAGNTVQHCYDNLGANPSRTVRRSFRAGAIRFQQ
jgi:hypothetical protein